MPLADWLKGSSHRRTRRGPRVLGDGALEPLESRSLLSTVAVSTLAVTAAPEIVSPGTTTSPGPVVTTTTPTFTWETVSGATGYQVNVYDITLKKFNSFTVGASATTYTPAAGTLASGDSFVWNVRGLVGTTTGEVSTYLYFQTPTSQLPAPEIVGPGTTTAPGPVLTTATPTFTWRAVTGATGYQINVYDTTLKKLNSFTVGASATTYTPAAGTLASGDSFVWNVRALNGSVSGKVSTYLFFQTPTSQLPAPEIVGPGTTTAPGPVLTTATPTFTWRAVTGATGYQINVYDTTLKKLNSFTVGASATTYTPAAGTLASGDSFVWNVRGLVGTTTGEVSTYLYFQTPTSQLPAPEIVGPGTTTAPGPVLTTATPTFTWRAVTGATGYQINVYDTTLKKLNSFTVGASATTYTPAAGTLASGDSFVWNVRALNGSVSGHESTYLYFQTPAAVTKLVAPEAISPGTTTSPGPVLTTTTPTFTWRSVAGATGYQINVYDITLKKFTSFTVGASSTSYTVAAGILASGDSFVWNVRGLIGTVSGPVSTYLYFQTRT